MVCACLLACACDAQGRLVWARPPAGPSPGVPHIVSSVLPAVPPPGACRCCQRWQRKAHAAERLGGAAPEGSAARHLHARRLTTLLPPTPLPACHLQGDAREVKGRAEAKGEDVARDVSDKAKDAADQIRP